MEAQRTAASSPAEALVNAAKFTAARFRIPPAIMEPSDGRNRLIFKLYLLTDLFRYGLLQDSPADSYMLYCESWRYLQLFDFAGPENAVRQRYQACVFCWRRSNDDGRWQAAAGLSFEPNTLRRH